MVTVNLSLAFSIISTFKIFQGSDASQGVQQHQQVVNSLHIPMHTPQNLQNDDGRAREEMQEELGCWREESTRLGANWWLPPVGWKVGMKYWCLFCVAMHVAFHLY